MKPRRGSAEQWLPLAYFVLALVLVVAILPSILRQQPPEQSQTAELSPDAPPDDEQQSIIASLNRGVTGTAGTGDGVGDGQGVGDAIAGGPGLEPVAPRLPAACPHGWGKPSRQTFSIYAAPCAPGWSGDNGGATSKGVTATEIRVAVGGPGGNSGTQGWVPDQPRPNESTLDRTWRVWQKWFNTRYQFWGRQIRFYVMNGSEEPTRQTAVAAAVADEVGAFAAAIGRPVLQAELARRKVIGFGEIWDQYDGEFMESRRPYVWTWHGDASYFRELTAEYVCGRLVGRNAVHAGDVLQFQPRRFALLYNDSVALRDTEPELRRMLAERCGLELDLVIGFPTQSSSSNDGRALATAVSRMREEGITTALVPLDFYSMIQLTNYAAAQGYFPEWVITGQGLNDYNIQGRLNNQASWSHAFGISGYEIEEPQGLDMGQYRNLDGYRAYKELEPDTEPDGNFPSYIFASLQQIANGIQAAGPRLTPETFEKGLWSIPLRTGQPQWAIQGGYRPGRYGYPDSVGEVWWDPSAVDSGGTAAAYRWTRGALRWRLGELPPGESTVFKEGIATRPADWRSHT